MICSAAARLSIAMYEVFGASDGWPTKHAGSPISSMARVTGSPSRAESTIAPSTNPPRRYSTTRSLSRPESTMIVTSCWSASDRTVFVPIRMLPMFGSSSTWTLGSCTMSATAPERRVTRLRAAALRT